MKLFYGFVLFLVCAFCSTDSHARRKDKTPPVLWKKLVIRVIDTRDTLDKDGGWCQGELGDTALMEFLLEEVLSNEIEAYSSVKKGASFESIIYGKRWTRNDLLKLTHQVDTGCAEDFNFVSIRDLKYPSKSDVKINVLEEWVFDPRSLTTDIRIIAIAPVISYFREDDSLLGTKSVFWLKWNDVKAILKQYPGKRQLYNLQRYIFDDYFRNNDIFSGQVSKIHNSGCKANFSRTVYRYIDLCPTERGVITNRYEFNVPSNDESLCKRIYEKTNKNEVAAFKVVGMRFDKTQLNPSDIKIWRHPDTTDLGGYGIHVDSASINWSFYDQYRIKECWNFDAYEGRARIETTGIAMALDSAVHHEFTSREKYYSKSATLYTQLFWVNVSEISDLLWTHTTWNIPNNVPGTIWQSYFKPMPPRYILADEHWRSATWFRIN